MNAHHDMGQRPCGGVKKYQYRCQCHLDKNDIRHGDGADHIVADMLGNLGYDGGIAVGDLNGGQQLG